MEDLRQVFVIKATKDILPDDKIKVAAYCRVSTDSDDQLNSFIEQVRYYTDFINQNPNMKLVDIYADEGVTGTSIAKRDEFNRMMSDTKKGKIDKIYVKSVSRFARNSKECLENIRLLKSYGISVFFENDGIDTKILNHEIILYIKSAFAEAESRNASKRMSRSNQMRMELGEFAFVTAPFGYKIEDRTLVPIPEEAEVVKKIFKYYLSGMGFGNIAQTLNNDNEVGKPWSKDTIRYMLSNEKYIGDTLHQKTYTPPVLPLKQVENKGQVPKYYVTNTHEPIIDKETFNSVKEMFDRNHNLNKEKSKIKKYQFTGYLYCGDCGWVFKKRKLNNRVYWQCTKDGQAGQRCYSHQISEEVIKRTFCRFYNRLRYYENEILRSTLFKLVELKKTLTKVNSGISEIDAEMLLLNDKLKYCYKLLESNTINNETFLSRETEIKNKMSRLRNKRLKLLSEDDDEVCIDELRNLIHNLEKRPKAIITFDYSIFKEILNRIIVEDNHFVFELKGGLSLREVIAWN